MPDMASAIPAEMAATIRMAGKRRSLATPKSSTKKRAGAGDDSDREGEPGARTLLLVLKRGAGEAVVMSMVVVVLP